MTCFGRVRASDCNFVASYDARASLCEKKFHCDGDDAMLSRLGDSRDFVRKKSIYICNTITVHTIFCFEHGTRFQDDRLY